MNRFFLFIIAVPLLGLILQCAPTRPIDQESPPIDSTKTKLVIFVHGYTGDADTWAQFAKLVATDPELSDFDTYNFRYSSSLLSWNNQRIRTIGDLLGSQLNERFAKYKEIHLIGHSMGGLVIQSMVIEQLKTGRARNLNNIRSVILFGTPNNGTQISKILRLFDNQLNDLAATEAFAEEIRNEWINRVYNPKILPGDENYKLAIPVTVVIGTEDEIVDERSVRSFFRDPEPVTVAGDHRSMKEPQDHNSDSYITVRRRLLAPPRSTYTTLKDADMLMTDPQMDLVIGEPFGSKTVIALHNSGVLPIGNAAVNLRCFVFGSKDDPNPALFFAGFPSVKNSHSWWAIEYINKNDHVTKEARDDLKRFLHNRRVIEQRPNITYRAVDTILAVDVVYHRSSDHKRYEFSGIARLLEDSKTGEPFLDPIPLSPFYRKILRDNPAPMYRMSQIDSTSNDGSPKDARLLMPSLLTLFVTDFMGKGSGGGVNIQLNGYADISFVDNKVLRVFYKVIQDFGSRSKFMSIYVPSSPNAHKAIEYLSSAYKQYLNVPLQFESGSAYSVGATKSEELIFTGRIFIYHEDAFSLAQLGRLAELYEKQKLSVEFRTGSYALSVWEAMRSGSTDPPPKYEIRDGLPKVMDRD